MEKFAAVNKNLHLISQENKGAAAARNEGLKKAIEKVLKTKVVELSVDPQLMGALGAAEFARKKGGAKQ